MQMVPGASTATRAIAVYGVANTNQDASSGGTTDHFVPALGILDLRFRVWLNSLYSSSATYSIFRCGLITDDGTAPNIKNGIYFEYNYNSNTNFWIATTASAGTVSRNNTTMALTAAAWMNLRILTDASWANAYFYVGGVLAKTVTGFTMPSNNMPLIITHSGGSGTGNSIYVDWVYMKYSYSRGTW